MLACKKLPCTPTELLKNAVPAGGLRGISTCVVSTPANCKAAQQSSQLQDCSAILLLTSPPRSLILGEMARSVLSAVGKKRVIVHRLELPFMIPGLALPKTKLCRPPDCLKNLAKGASSHVLFWREYPNFRLSDVI
eukprot:scaffold1136_cov146-Cylindrotheca_fusiformis.AAC.2